MLIDFFGGASSVSVALTKMQESKLVYQIADDIICDKFIGKWLSRKAF